MASNSLRATMVGAVSTAVISGGLMFGAAPAQAHAGLPSVCKSGRIVCIDKSTRTIRFLINGRTQVKLAARFGASRTPTRTGMFRIYWKDANHVSSVFGSAMPYSMFFSGGQAIHFSSDFARRGYNGASHGCVNTRNYSATRSLFNRTRTGDRVYVYWG
jgi:lipoprotein-anchoring transpeptidase ErfK/SrfK